MLLAGVLSRVETDRRIVETRITKVILPQVKAAFGCPNPYDVFGSRCGRIESILNGCEECSQFEHPMSVEAGCQMTRKDETGAGGGRELHHPRNRLGVRNPEAIERGVRDNRF